MKTTIQNLVNVGLSARTEDDLRVVVISLQRHPSALVLKVAKQLSARPDARSRLLGVWLLSFNDRDGSHLRRTKVELLKRICSAERSATVLARAIRSLGQSKGRVEEQMIAGFFQHRSTVVRRAVAQALDNFQNPTSIPVIKVLAKDPDATVREWVAFNLGQTNRHFRTVAIAALRRLLDDSSGHVRNEAARGLVYQGDYAVLPRIQRLLKSCGVKWESVVRVLKLFRNEMQSYAVDDALVDALCEAVRKFFALPAKNKVNLTRQPFLPCCQRSNRVDSFSATNGSQNEPKLTYVD